MPVHIGDVYTVQGAKADKAQALKILEEAAEVFSAWECCEHDSSSLIRAACLRDELADLITAACGMLAAMGFDDAERVFEFCKVRNEMRGRVME